VVWSGWHRRWGRCPLRALTPGKGRINSRIPDHGGGEVAHRLPSTGWHTLSQQLARDHYRRDTRRSGPSTPPSPALSTSALVTVFKPGRGLVRIGRPEAGRGRDTRSSPRSAHGVTSSVSRRCPCHRTREARCSVLPPGEVPVARIVRLHATVLDASGALGGWHSAVVAGARACFLDLWG
jgi:hypothetical protein